jgi:hypothetical protein
VNFATDVVEAADPKRLALVELTRSGERHEWTFGAIARRARILAAELDEQGVRPRRHGADADRQPAGVGRDDGRLLPPGLRRACRAPSSCGPRTCACASTPRSPRWSSPTSATPARSARRAGRARRSGHRGGAQRSREAPPAPELEPDDPCLITFTSGTTGAPAPILHGQRYLSGQGLQAERWLDARTGDLVWCTAASGWSKSARNVFIAPWIRGAAALLHDARFDPDERVAILARERVDVLCMAPTEYRVIVKRTEPRAIQGRRAASRGEALNEVLRRRGTSARAVDSATPLRARRRPAADGARAGRARADRVDGPRAARRRAGIDDGRARGRPGDRRRPTSSAAPRRRAVAHRAELRDAQWTRDGFLFFEGRTDDVIISGRLPDRPVRGRVRRSSPSVGRPRAPVVRRRRQRSAGRSRAARVVVLRGRVAAATSWPASCRTTSRRRPRPTSTRGSSSSRPSCRRPTAARSVERSCAVSRSQV